MVVFALRNGWVTCDCSSLQTCKCGFCDRLSGPVLTCRRDGFRSVLQSATRTCALAGVGSDRITGGRNDFRRFYCILLLLEKNRIVRDGLIAIMNWRLFPGLPARHVPMLKFPAAVHIHFRHICPAENSSGPSQWRQRQCSNQLPKLIDFIRKHHSPVCPPTRPPAHPRCQKATGRKDQLHFTVCRLSGTFQSLSFVFPTA